MKKIFTFFLIFIGFMYSYAQSNIEGYEYWFNNEFANKTTTNITATPLLIVNQNIPTAGLTAGLNVFNFRSFDDAGKYSAVLSHFFYKTPTSQSNPTPEILAYEYWIDNDYANAVMVNTPAQQQINISELIAMNSLNIGIHNFNIRFKDNAGLWSSVMSHFFYKTPTSQSNPTPEILAYEYWIDNDYANAVMVNTPAQQQINISELISMNSLSTGIHNFNIRFKDNAGLWSSVMSHFFYKTPTSQSNPTPENLAYEYWIDNDYANAVMVNTPAQQQINISELISMNSLSTGIHNFNIRFKDNAGLWSSVMSHFFYKTPTSQSNPTPEILAYEYWIDNDYANAVMVNTPAQQQINISELISMNSLSTGIHNFNIRFKDNAGLWSSVMSHFFYKMPEQTITNNLITNYRYWIDNDFANVVNIFLEVPTKQINLIDNLDFTQILKGVHTLHFQFRDSLGLWSSVTTDSIIKLSLPISDFTYTEIVECDSTIINYTDLSIDGDTYLWDFGDGMTDTIANPTHTYYSSGWYDVGLTITDTLTFVENTKQISILITGNTSNSISVISCDSYSSPSGNYSFTTSGIYTDTIQNQWSCDSILTINLIINYSTAFTDIITACDSYTWIDEVTYTASNNTAIFILSNSQDCDSIVTLNLTINQTPDASVLQDGITLTAVANAPGITYQWCDCNNNMEPLSGETSQSFTAIVNGRYALEISENDCIGVSDCYTINSVGILTNGYKSEILLYPNPTNGKLYLEMGQTYPETIIKTYDIYGKLVNQFVFKNQIKLEFFINDVNGIYLLDVQSGNQKALIKVIKN